MLKKICDRSDLKLLDDGTGHFEGYGSTFGNFDRAKEAVVKGAFENTLARFKADGFIAVGHDWSGLPVATINDAYEDEKGLYIKGEFHSTSEAQSARTVVKERIDRGKSVGLSIGYAVKEKEKTDDGLLLKELDLFEVSIVTVPCNPMAQATGAKDGLPGEFKAQYLGEYIEASMTMAALSRLQDALFYNVVWGCLYDENTPLPEKLDTLRAAFDEFRDLSLRTIEAILSSTETDATEVAGKAIRALWRDPAGVTDLSDFLLAEKSLGEHSDTTLAVVREWLTRISGLKALRVKEGRTLSDANRQRLHEHVTALEGVCADLKDLLDQTAPASTDDALKQLARYEYQRMLHRASTV